jgi:uncharacterized membrane protein
VFVSVGSALFLNARNSALSLGVHHCLDNATLSQVITVLAVLGE